MAPPAQPEKEFPYWLVAAGIVAVLVAWVIVANDLYARTFNAVIQGLSVTVFVTLIGFTLASAFGLLLAVMSLSGSVIARQVARFYIEIIRGVPILVLLFYIAFVGAPALV